MGALDAAGVRVERGVERALGCGEVTQHEVEGLRHHLEIVGPTRQLPRVQVGAGQQGLVGEHFLEVRYEPARVRRVAAEPADQVVVDATGRHGVECPHGHMPRLIRLGPGGAPSLA